MSAIFAYAGNTPCKDIITDAVSRLSGENFELSGIAMKNGEKIETVRIKGNPVLLGENAGEISDSACIGLGESKRASRCKPAGITAPPASNELFCAALDGVIENFESLKKEIKNPFPVATDEDLLLSLLTSMSYLGAYEIISALDGIIAGGPGYAFIPINENAIYAKAGKTPLAVGVCDDGYCVSSELSVIVPFAKKYFLLESGEYAKITDSKVFVFDKKKKRLKKSCIPCKSNIRSFRSCSPFELSTSLPLTVKNTVSALVSDGRIDFGFLKFTSRTASRIKRIIITGSGASFRCAQLAAWFTEAFCDVPCAAYEAGELKYSGTFFDRNTMLIAVSPSGEEKDVLYCVKRANSFQSITLGVTENSFSMLGKECKTVIKTEVYDKSSAVLSFVSCALTLELFALWAGNKSEIISDMYLSVATKLAELLPGKISGALKPSASVKSAARLLLSHDKIFVTGTGADSALSNEAADEIRSSLSLNACSFSCSELALNTPEILSESLIICFITDREKLECTLYYLRRFVSLGADVLIYTTANIENEISGFERIITVTDSLPVFDTLSALSALLKTLDTAKEILLEEEKQQAV